MASHSPKWPAFRDPLIQEEFHSRGYVVIDLVDPGELHRLLDSFHRLYPYDREGCVFSFQDSDPQRRIHAQDLLRNVIEPKAIALLNEYQFVSGAFIAKHPGEKSVVRPHTDLTFVDPESYSAIAVWTPLTELTPDAGTLHVLPGSHLYTSICGSNLFRRYPSISISRMVKVKPEVGQAVCYNLQIIHASPANTSADPRIAANCVFAPAAAQLLHYTQRDGIVYCYAVDQDFYYARSGDENANQKLLSAYAILDSQPADLYKNFPSGNRAPRKIATGLELMCV